MALQEFSRGNVFIGKINEFAGRYFGYIDAHFPTSHFLTRDRAIDAHLAQFWLRFLRRKTYLGLGMGCEHTDPEQVISGVFRSFEHLYSSISINQGIGVVLPR